MADALDGEFDRSRAVLLSAWDYAEFPSVRAADNSHDRFFDLLTGPLCNWPRERVTSLAGQASLADLPHRLVREFVDVTDVALFYFVGHGQYDYQNQLCLALGDSSVAAAYRNTTSLTFEQVRNALRISKARTKIAILDCCFAGLAAEADGRLAAGPVVPAATGFYLLMACGPHVMAWHQLDGEAAKPQTYLTKYLVDAVERGVPGEGEGVRLGPLFQAVAEHLVRDGKPEPGARVSDQAGEFVLARNRAAGRRGRDLTADATLSFREALRETAVQLKVPTRCGGCAGVGRLGAEPCEDCRGTGYGPLQRTVETVLPRGVADGRRILLTGQGFPSPSNGVPGDLAVTVHVRPDPVFGRIGNDLTTEVAASHVERLYGTTVSLRAPTGQWLAVTIPPETPCGTVLTVPHHGVDLAQERGDLLVTVTEAAPADAAADAELRPPGPAVARPAAPDPGSSATVFRASVRRQLGTWWLALVGATLAALLITLAAVLPPLPWGGRWTTAAGPICASVLFVYGRRVHLRRRPPLWISDDGIDYARFGYLTWADIACVWPSGPGHPWVTVMLRRTQHLSTGQPSPLVVPVILLADLRRNSEPVVDAMRRHCPSLPVHARQTGA